MTPKTEFQKDEARVRAHQQLVDSQVLKDGLMVAFNELCFSELHGSTTPERVLWENAKREGAKLFMNTFLHLADRPVQRTPSKTGQLENPDARYNERYGRRQPGT